jgi:hypothetical protein
MKDDTTDKISKASKAERGTDWEALRRKSDAEIHAGIEADPDAHATDDAFWKAAMVVMPVEALTEADKVAIAEAEIPAEYRHLDHELKP